MRVRWMVPLVAAAVALVAGASTATATATAAPAAQQAVQDVDFRSGDVTLHGTITEAAGAPGPRPGIVLVHGAGPEKRAGYRAEAEAMAQAGFVVLSYDKRTTGYSMTQRSYSQLADDALAGVRTLAERTDVDPHRIGLWGFSEGGWVAPLAASRSEQVSYVVVVGASGPTPARQQAWHLDNKLRHEGASGSLLETVSVTGTRLLSDAGLFPEADYDPVPVLEHLHQPVLALWGNDKQVPPAESAAVLADALHRGGNDDLTLRFFPQADHKLHVSADGFARGEQLTPGYVDTVAAWVAGHGHRVNDPLPRQDRRSQALASVPAYQGSVAQAAAFLLMALAFAGYLLSGLVRRLRRRPVAPGGRAARWLAGTGLAATLGFLGYFLFVTTTLATGPQLGGRPLVWSVLQLLAVGTVVATGVTAVQAWRGRRSASAGARVRLGGLLVAGAVFVPWALFWGLLLP
ncbi:MULTISPECIES: prolyl oligopeptidase family serine peptidase [unclassified Kitasatospora]|uniref:alpha/beta hydrolase family protein n=1 Tax=unclassified Kitasatospora TaxID=2633591 RepID=UPI00340812CB